MSNSIWARTATNIKRSGWRSYAMIFMMTVTFFILAILLTVIYISYGIANYLIQKPEIIGYFKEGVPEEQILQVKKEFDNQPFVFETRYVSKEDAMKSFIAEKKDNEEIVASVTTNPFPAHLNVKAVSLSNVQDVVNMFNNQEAEFIESVDDSQEYLEALGKIVQGIQVISGVLLVIFTISTVFIIFLAIGLTVYAHKTEISIMKLVGATNNYVRMPYMLQSVFTAMVSVVIASIIWGGLLASEYNKVMSSISNEIISPMNIQVISLGVLIMLSFAIMLSFLSSYFATKRYIDR